MKVFVAMLWILTACGGAKEASPGPTESYVEPPTKAAMLKPKIVVNSSLPAVLTEPPKPDATATPQPADGLMTQSEKIKDTGKLVGSETPTTRVRTSRPPKPSFVRSCLEAERDHETLRTVYAILNYLDAHSCTEAWDRLTRVSSLDLSRSQIKITELGPIGAIRHLRRLSIRGHRVYDIEPLRNLRQLRQLDIRGTHVSDYSPIAELPRLKRVLADGKDPRGK